MRFGSIKVLCAWQGPSEIVCDAYKDGTGSDCKREKRKRSAESFEKQKKPYDYLVVGAGLYGAVFASEMTKTGKTLSGH